MEKEEGEFKNYGSFITSSDELKKLHLFSLRTSLKGFVKHRTL
jgi:hypothetical protein